MDKLSESIPFENAVMRMASYYKNYYAEKEAELAPKLGLDTVYGPAVGTFSKWDLHKHAIDFADQKIQEFFRSDEFKPFLHEIEKRWTDNSHSTFFDSFMFFVSLYLRPKYHSALKTFKMDMAQRDIKLYGDAFHLTSILQTTEQMMTIVDNTGYDRRLSIELERNIRQFLVEPENTAASTKDVGSEIKRQAPRLLAWLVKPIAKKLDRIATADRSDRADKT